MINVNCEWDKKYFKGLYIEDSEIEKILQNEYRGIVLVTNLKKYEGYYEGDIIALSYDRFQNIGWKEGNTPKIGETVRFECYIKSWDTPSAIVGFIVDPRDIEVPQDSTAVLDEVDFISDQKLSTKVLQKMINGVFELSEIDGAMLRNEFRTLNTKIKLANFLKQKYPNSNHRYRIYSALKFYDHLKIKENRIKARNAAAKEYGINKDTFDVILRKRSGFWSKKF